MDRLILHGGIHKTGSSALQETLARGMDDPGFEYVILQMPNGSRAIAQAFDGKFVKRAAKRGRVIAPGESDRIRTRSREQIAQALANVRAPTGIVSAERLIKLGRADIDDMIAQFRRHAGDIEFAAYVRDVRGYVESAFQQRVREVRLEVNATRFRLTMSKWFGGYDAVLGADRVRLWKYEPERLSGGDITADFCRRIGARFDPLKAGRHNEGLSLDAIRLLWLYREMVPRRRAGDDAILKRLGALTGDKLRFGAAMLDRLTDLDVAEIRAVEKRVEAPLLTADFDRHPGNVHSIEDLSTPSPGALDWLGRQTGTPVQRLGTQDAVAEAVGRLAPA